MNNLKKSHLKIAGVAESVHIRKLEIFLLPRFVSSVKYYETNQRFSAGDIFESCELLLIIKKKKKTAFGNHIGKSSSNPVNSY